MEEFDIAFILKWLPLLNVVVIPAAAWIIRAATQSMATKADIAAQAVELGRLARRVDLMERDIKHLPDADDFAGLKEQIAALTGAEKAQTQQLVGLSQSVARIEDWLMRGVK